MSNPYKADGMNIAKEWAKPGSPLMALPIADRQKATSWADLDRRAVSKLEDTRIFERVYGNVVPDADDEENATDDLYETIKWFQES